MSMVNCAQCGRSFDTNKGGVTDATIRMGTFLCSAGCLNAYKQQNNLIHPIDAVAGLVGKGIGNALDRKKNRVAQEAEEKANREQEQEEEREQRRIEREAAAASRHVITHDVMCPVCDAEVTANMASDGVTKVRCKQCKARLEVDHDGDVTVLGPKDEPLAKTESLKITEDRYCTDCKFFKSPGAFWLKYLIFTIAILAGLYGYMTFSEIHRILVIIAVVLLGIVLLIAGAIMSPSDKCSNKKAISLESNRASWNNPNLRCKFWKQK